jgi:hypothetical protein
MRLLPLAAVLLLAGCGGSGTPAATPSPTRSPVVSPTPQPLPTIVGKPVIFSTADGNVACDLEAAYARCDVRARSWRAPTKPSDCHNTWGGAVEVAAGSPATFICWFGRSPLGAKRVLRPGQALQVGLMSCRALADGVECGGQGHSFRLGRASYVLS